MNRKRRPAQAKLRRNRHSQCRCYTRSWCCQVKTEDLSCSNSRAKRAQTLSLPISDSGSDYGDLSCRHSESSFWLVGKSNTTDGRDALRSTRNATIPKTRHRDHDLAHWILGIATMTKMKTVVD